MVWKEESVTMRRLLVSAVVVLAVATTASADIVGVAGGAGAPPATLGGFTMTPFGADPQPMGMIASVASPLGGDLGLHSENTIMTHKLVSPEYSGIWRNGYAGDVYTTNGVSYHPQSVTITMPAGTGAFYFYCSDDGFGGPPYIETATAQNGVSISQSIIQSCMYDPGHGFYGAPYYGFYGTNGDLISSITITGDDPFAVGQFGIANVAPVPLPGALILGALGLTFAGWRLKR
jgi:hypothetical protein